MRKESSRLLGREYRGTVEVGGEVMVEPYKPLYTVKEVAKILKTNPDFVYGIVNQKLLPALKLGAIKVRGSDLERFIEKYPVMNPEEVQE